MYSIYKETAAVKKEIEIRGRYLMMACDIEFSLLNIIMFSNPDPYNHERVGQFKKMKMAGKIESAICDIKKYKREYYEEFKPAFDGLEEFRIVRNDMSHSVGMFPNDPDLAVFKIHFIDADEAGIEAFRYKDYTEDYILQSLTRFSIINNHLAALFYRLKKEFELKGGTHPFAHPSTGNG